MKSFLLFINLCLAFSVTGNDLPKNLQGEWFLDVGRSMVLRKGIVAGEQRFDLKSSSITLTNKGASRSQRLDVKVKSVEDKKVIFGSNEGDVLLEIISEEEINIKFPKSQPIGLSRTKKNCIAVISRDRIVINGKPVSSFDATTIAGEMKNAEVYAMKDFPITDMGTFLVVGENPSLVFIDGTKVLLKPLAMPSAAKPAKPSKSLGLTVLRDKYKLNGKEYSLDQVSQELKKVKDLKEMTLKVDTRVKVKQMYLFFKKINMPDLKCQFQFIKVFGP